jgi:hypothetical protein
MGSLLAAVLLLAAAADRVEHAGGTVAGVPRGRGAMDLTDGRALIYRAGAFELRIAYDSVNQLEYGQQVSRRYGMAVVVSPLLLLSKKRQHFLTVGYKDETGAQQALVFKVDKRCVRAVLAGLEARTGRRVEYQDIEARKAGKGS